MPSDVPFRVALLAILGGTMIVVGYHRLKAAKSGEHISRRDEGLLLAVALRLSGLCVWMGTFAYLIDPKWMEWAHVALPDWLRWLGAAFGMLGWALMFWTLTNLGRNLTVTVMTRANATFVNTGPYRWVRHPFYVTVALLTPAAALVAANWFIALGASAVLAMLVVRTTKEEQKLIEKFPNEYPPYISVTGRFWPKMRQRYH